MKLQTSSKNSKADILFITLFKEEKLSSETKKAIGPSLYKEFEARVKAKDFGGAEGQNLTLFPSKGNYNKVIFLGRGDKKEQIPNATESLGGKITGMCKGAKSAEVMVGKDAGELAYGISLGAYSYDRYKKKDKKAVKLEKITLVGDSNVKAKDINIFSEASKLVRDLVNAPAGDLTTKAMESEARKVAKKYGLKMKVIDKKGLVKLGCGSILGVGQGAEHEPRMIILEYKHKTKSKVPNIAFIGKGIVFDTGGLNLKPTGYMETMKQDMAGAATVLGTIQAIAHAKIPGHFLAVLCCAENAISEKAQRPGDVVKSFNGKTIEVTNTDAEGRLVLADGLAYTEKIYKPKIMVNIATLTGAVSVALGHFITGVMGNNQKLIDEILKLAKENHERMWQLPLDADFVKATKGSFTDLKNSTDGVRAGSTMGGAFLSNFVDKVKWAHFDIGGTAWTDKPTSTTKYGATASALRTFIALANKHRG